MARGRRPNLEKEPNRQLENQRAFRRRRAERLAHLQERIAKLEQENQALRQESHQGADAQGNPADGDEPTCSSYVCDACHTSDAERRQLIPSIQNVDDNIKELSRAVSAMKDILETSTSGTSSLQESVTRKQASKWIEKSEETVNSLPKSDTGDSSMQLKPSPALSTQSTSTSLLNAGNSLAIDLPSNNFMSFSTNSATSFPFQPSYSWLNGQTNPSDAHQQAFPTNNYPSSCHPSRIATSNFCLSLVGCRPQSDCPFVTSV